MPIRKQLKDMGKNVKICKKKVISSLFPETLRTPKKGIV